MKCPLCNGTGSRVMFHKPVICDCALSEPEPSPEGKSALVLEDMKASAIDDECYECGLHKNQCACDDYCPCCGNDWADCYCDEEDDDYY